MLTKSVHCISKRIFKFLQRVLLVITILLITNPQDLFAKANEQKNKTIQQRTKLVDNIHDDLSRRILNFSDQLDSFLGDERIDRESNTTRLRFFTITTKNEDEFVSTTGDMRLQLTLPRTQRRLQLVLERDRQEEEDSSEKTRPANERESQDVNSGLRFVFEKSEIKYALTSGVRLSSGAIPFLRARVQKPILFKVWNFRPSMTLDHEITTKDSRLQIRAPFERPLLKKTLLRFIHNIDWNNTDYEVTYNIGPRLFVQLSDRLVFFNGLNITYIQRPISYRLFTGLRKNLYKGWLYGQIDQSLYFNQEDNYKRNPVTSLLFEVILGHI